MCIWWWAFFLRRKRKTLYLLQRKQLPFREPSTTQHILLPKESFILPSSPLVIGSRVLFSMTDSWRATPIVTSLTHGATILFVRHGWCFTCCTYSRDALDHFSNDLMLGESLSSTESPLSSRFHMLLRSHSPQHLLIHMYGRWPDDLTLTESPSTLQRLLRDSMARFSCRFTSSALRAPRSGVLSECSVLHESLHSSWPTLRHLMVRYSWFRSSLPRIVPHC